MIISSCKKKAREEMQPFMNQPFMNQYPFAPIQNGINGMYVDNRQVVDATQCDLSGKPLFLPTTDGNAIYVKQLDSLGKSHITTYKKEIEQIPVDDSTKFDEIYSKLEELSEKIDKIKPMKARKEVEE